MKKTVRCLYGLATFLLIIATACSPRDETVTPGDQLSSETVVSTEMFVPTVWNIFQQPVQAISTPTRTSIPGSVYQLSDRLPAGEYLGSIPECSSNQPCNIHIFAVDGSSTQSPIEIQFNGSSAYQFIYRNGSLAFTVNREDAHSNSLLNVIQVVDIESGDGSEIQIPHELNCQTEDWSPDAMQLLLSCAREDGTSVIAILTASSGEIAILLDGQKEVDSRYGYFQPRWSLDGKQILFYKSIPCGGCESTRDLYVFNTSCILAPSTCQAEARLLTIPVPAGDGQFIGPTLWTPDNYIAIAVNDQIKLYDSTSGQHIRTYNLDSGEKGIDTIVWSPDGKWILVTRCLSPDGYLIPIQSYLRSIPGDNWINLNIPLENPFWITIP